MFYGKSIQSRVSRALFGMASIACVVLFVVFSFTYYINAQHEIKDEILEEVEELFLFGLRDATPDNTDFFNEELTEMLMLHHLSVRILENGTSTWIKTGIFVTKEMEYPLPYVTKAGFESVYIESERYLRYLHPFVRSGKLSVIEILTPKRPFMEVIAPFVLPFGVAFVIFLLITAPLVLWFSSALVFPIRVLDERLKQLHTGNMKDPILTYKNDDEIAELVASIESVKARFSTLFHSLSRYSSMVSHEIRNKLVVLQTQIEKIDGDYLKQRHAIETVHSISHCLDSLKCLHLLEEGQYPIEESVGQVSFIVNSVVEQFVEKERVQILTPFEGVVETDITLLKMVLKNCFENALRHSSSEVKVSFQDGVLALENECSESDYMRLTTAVEMATSGDMSRTTSLGVYLVVRLSNAMGIFYDVTFNKEANILVQTLKLD